MSKVSALVVDDCEIDRYLLVRQLKMSGVGHVFERDDGQSALEFFEDYEKNRALHPDKYPPVVIFLDVNMPIINGFDFLDKFAIMRQSNEFFNIKVVMYSSSDLQEDISRATAFEFVRSFEIKGQMSLDRLKIIIEQFSQED